MEYQYQLTRGRRSSISIKISSQGKIIVKAPFAATDEQVKAFLLEKRSWILNHISKVEEQNKKAQEQGLFSEEELKELKKKARKIIPPRVEHYAKISGIKYNRIAIRCQRSRWGSCSAQGNLNFNCLLVLMPEPIMDSVIVHELVHRHHMDHSKAFYTEVLSIFPDYKRCDKWLKTNGLSYLNRVPEFLD